MAIRKVHLWPPGPKGSPRAAPPRCSLSTPPSPGYHILLCLGVWEDYWGLSDCRDLVCLDQPPGSFLSLSEDSLEELPFCSGQVQSTSFLLGRLPQELHLNLVVGQQCEQVPQDIFMPHTGRVSGISSWGLFQLGLASLGLLMRICLN